MKKRKVAVIIICGIVVAVGIVYILLFIRPFDEKREAPTYSENAIRYEYDDNNLLGLKAITIDNNKYIYEFSSYRYLNRWRVHRINKYSYAEGWYRTKTDGDVHGMVSFDLYYSGKSTYIIIEPEIGKGDFISFDVFFYLSRRSIGVGFFENACVTRTKYNYKIHQSETIYQIYHEGEWEKEDTYKNRIGDYY